MMENDENVDKNPIMTTFNVNQFLNDDDNVNDI